MAATFDVQSLINQISQSSVPSGVNNGNPNTVFNIPGPPNVWDFAYSNPMDPRPIWTGMTTAPYTPTPPTTPTTDPNGGGGGGTGGPLTNGGGGGGLTNLPSGDPHDNINANRVGDALSRASATQGLRWNGTTYTNKDGSALTIPQWQQLLDMGLDVLGIGGNWFLSGSGNWDTSNILAGLLSSFTGLPVNNIMTMIGKYGAEHGWSENNVFVDHYMDNVQNELDSFSKQLSKKVGEQINNIGQQNIANSNAFHSTISSQGTAAVNPSSLSSGQWANLLAGTSAAGGVHFGPTAFAGLGGVGVGTTNGGTGNLASGGIFGGGSGNFGSGGSLGHAGGGIPSVLTHNGFYGVITDPTAIAEFMDSMRESQTRQPNADLFGHMYEV